MTGVAQAADSGSCPTAAASYAGGSGTNGDPFLIATPEQLQRLRDTSADWNDAVLLTADIDMGGCVWGTTLGDTRVTPWTGDFDGGGHIISGLDIDLTLTGTGYAGLFAYLGAGSSLTGLGFTGDVSMTYSRVGNGSAYAGGLVGFTLGGLPISDSFATGDVTIQAAATADGNGDASMFADAGGLIGVSQGAVTNAYATGDVTVTATATGSGSGQARVSVNAGGLISDKGAGTATSTYSTGTVTTALSATGGISPSEVTQKGGLAGVNAGTFVDSAWNTTTSGESSGVGFGSGAGVTGLTTTQMRDVVSFGQSGLDWSIAGGYSSVTTWSMCPGYNSGFPFLSAFESGSLCSEPEFAAIDGINVGGTPRIVVVSGKNTASTTDDTIYVTDGSTIHVYPPLATNSSTATQLQVDSTVIALAVTDDTIYAGTRGGGGASPAIQAFPVGATGSPSATSVALLTDEPSAIAVGGQGTPTVADDSVYVVAYNNSNGIWQFSPSLNDSGFVNFTLLGVQPGDIQISGGATATTADDTVYIRGNRGGDGALIEMTPSLDDSTSRSPLGFGGSDFLIYDDSFLFSSYNIDRIASVSNVDDSYQVELFGSTRGAVNATGDWLAINGPGGIIGVGPVTQLVKTSILNLGLANGFVASADAASDGAFYVVGGVPTMSVVDSVTAGAMTPTTGAWGTTVTLPFLTGSARLADDSTITNVEWAGQPVSHTRLAGRNAVQVQVPQVYGPAEVVIELRGGESISLGTFVGPANPTPPVPTPATAPTSLSAVTGDGQATLSWQPPQSAGTFPVTSYQVSGDPSGECLVRVPETECDIVDLSNGVEYSFRVRALTGAGWGAWSPTVSVIPTPPTPEPSIVITGSRDRGVVRVAGVAPGLIGQQVTPWFRFPGPMKYTPGRGVQTVHDDGTFTWQRRTNKKVYVYFRASDDERSNRVIIPAR